MWDYGARLGMAYARRTDANQKDVIEALTAVGWYCLDLSRAGHGAPDILACRGGRMVAIEVKDGSKSPSARVLTPLEAEVHAHFAAHGCPVVVIESVEQAARL